MTRDFGVKIFKTKMKTGGAVFCSLLVVLAMVLNACGSASAHGKSTALTVSTGPDGDFTKTFSPYSPDPDPGTLGMVYEPLLMYDNITGHITPWLATGYQFENGNKTIVFDIRQGVKWSDGKPFTAADVAFTFNLLKKYPAADSNALWKTFNSVVATGPYTVTITLKYADTPILYYAGGETYMLPQHIFAAVGDPTRYLNTSPVGTGPFELDTFSPQLITYKKNPNYWQPGKPAVTELRYPAYDSNQSLELDLDQGNLDWTNVFTPDVQKSFVSRDPAHNKYWFPSVNNVILFLNLQKAPFNQLAVRQAISDALDHQRMSTVAEDGYEPVASPTGLLLPSQNSYLAPGLGNLTPTVDTAKAISLLESAGFTRGSDGMFRDKSGKELTYNIDVVTGWTDWVTDCQIIASNLKAIGINATTNALSYDSYISDLQTGNYSMAVSWTTAGPSPYYFYNALLSSQESAAIGKTATSNYERWIDPATDKLLNEYATTTDPTVQKQAIDGLEKIMVQQIPSIPLVDGADFAEYNTTNFTNWPDQSNPYIRPQPGITPDSEDVVVNLKPVS